MSQREDLFRQFGPLLLEATIDFLLDNVNTLRKERGMKEITKDEYLTQLSNHFSELKPYYWMKDIP